jgi:hypothetical protein
MQRETMSHPQYHHLVRSRGWSFKDQKRNTRLRRLALSVFIPQVCFETDRHGFDAFAVHYRQTRVDSRCLVFTIECYSLLNPMFRVIVWGDAQSCDEALL